MGDVVTVAGQLASGKSRVCRDLAAALGYDYVSTGQLQREIAEGLGMNSLELNLHSEGNPAIDEQIDGTLVRLGESPGNYVVDSRMAWHFLPNSLKVYLTVDADVASQRVLGDRTRENEPRYASAEEAKELMTARMESERRRFLDTYGVDCGDRSNYDIVLDTTSFDAEQVVEQLIERVERWRADARQTG